MSKGFSFKPSAYLTQHIEKPAVEKSDIVLKSGKSGYVVLLTNTSKRDVYLTSTVHQKDEISLHDTIYGSVEAQSNKIGPGVTGEITLSKKCTIAVYAWISSSINTPIPSDAYPQAAAVFDDDGQLIESLYSATALRLQTTNKDAVYYFAEPTNITIANNGNSSIWYDIQSTNEGNISLNQGQFGGAAIELPANSTQTVNLLRNTYHSKVFMWGSVNNGVPANGTHANLALLVSNGDGAILQKESDGVLEFQNPSNTQWNVTQVGNGSGTQAGVPGWVWVILAIVVGIIILLAILGAYSGRRKSNTYVKKSCGGAAKCSTDLPGAALDVKSSYY